MNGYTWPERRQIESFQQLEGDGTTAGGGWLYPEGMEALGGDCPFIMIAHGKASLFTRRD